jgi:hypothetical protein
VSPTTMTSRRRIWLAGSLLAVAALLVWLIGSGSDDPTPDAEPGQTTPSATSSPTPDAAPSSGPTGTPSTGSLDEVPVEEPTTAPPVPLTQTADFGTGMKLRIAQIESVEGVARGPGEIEGPALRLTLRMSNGSSSAVSLESVIVDLTTGGDHVPAATLTGPGGKPFEGEVPAKGSVTAVYVFAVPEDARDHLQVAVSYVSDAPVVLLAGAVA